MSKKDNTGREKMNKAATVVDDFIVEFRPYKTELTQKFLNRKPWEPEDENKVKSFIPGTIVKIYVKVGDRIDEGKPLMILEAMKMKNTVFAPFNATVESVHVEEGDKVSKNKLIFELRRDE